jgi:glycosyltransferase involved in cell wall biosynthesis
MKVVFFSKGDFEVVSSRYRCFYFVDALRECGILASICTPPPKRFGWRPAWGRIRELLRLARELGKVTKHDIAYLQRPLQNQDFILLIVLWKVFLRRKMVFDFCDPVFMHSHWKTKLLTHLADAVIVSCEDLAEWARHHNANVHIIPNCPKPQVPGAASYDRQAGACVIGWAGSAKDHKDNLRVLFSVLSKLSSSFTFRLIGARGADDIAKELRELEFESEVIDWIEPESAEAALAELDIAVLPVRDTQWNKKLLTKLIDYLAAGLPIVASPVGENRLAIVEGENGLLARSEAEWVEKLDRLLSDEALRHRLGKKARETARTRYSLAANGRRLAKILRDMTSGATGGQGFQGDS